MRRNHLFQHLEIPVTDFKRKITISNRIVLVNGVTGKCYGKKRKRN